MPVVPSRRLAPLVGAAAACGLVLAIRATALAATGGSLGQRAEAACLEAAASQGWRPDRARVVSSRALDADRVAVVFDLTKDGIHTARLTCPYSARSGVVQAFTTRQAEVGAAPEGEASAPPGLPVDPGRAWWLLLPVALGVGSWLWLSRHEEPIGYPIITVDQPTTPPPPLTHRAEAAAREGVVAIHQQPDSAAPVLRQIRNGSVFQITGARRWDASREDWLEVSGGGWVRDRETRYDRNIVR